MRPAVWIALALGAALPGFAQDADALLKAMNDFNSVQVVYRAGTPHTDRNGNLLTDYDPQRSFFQIGIWGNPWGDIYGVNYDLKVLTDAGINTMWPWPGRKLADQLAKGQEAGLQVVVMNAVDPAEAATLKDHPAWLGNVWMDEPTGALWGKDMEAKYQEFLAYKQRINAAAPGRAVFINDCPWVTAPATTWWAKWNTAGDVSCHDNYPILARKHRSQTIGDEGSKTGIPTSVGPGRRHQPGAEARLADRRRLQPAQPRAFPFRFATPMELRAQVYAGLIHGATGIVYFTWDTYVCRDGAVMGMAPDPQVAYVARPEPDRTPRRSSRWSASSQPPCGGGHIHQPGAEGADAGAPLAHRAGEREVLPEDGGRAGQPVPPALPAQAAPRWRLRPPDRQH